MNMSGKGKYPYDAANVLRAEGLAALTAATDLAVVALSSTGARWQTLNDIRDDLIVVVANVTAITGTGGKLEVFSASDASKSNPTLAYTARVNGAGQVVLKFDPSVVVSDDTDATHWYVKFTPDSTSGATFSAWVSAAARR
jgi:hypothetical protein